MRTALAATALAAALGLAGSYAAASAAADDVPAPRSVPVATVVEDEGPGTEAAPVVREDEGPGTEAAPVVREDEGPGTAEPRYGCVDGVCDTRGESSEGPGTD